MKHFLNNFGSLNVICFKFGFIPLTYFCFPLEWSTFIGIIIRIPELMNLLQSHSNHSKPLLDISCVDTVLVTLAQILTGLEIYILGIKLHSSKNILRHSSYQHLLFTCFGLQTNEQLMSLTSYYVHWWPLYGLRNLWHVHRAHVASCTITQLSR